MSNVPIFLLLCFYIGYVLICGLLLTKFVKYLQLSYWRYILDVVPSQLQLVALAGK